MRPRCAESVAFASSKRRLQGFEKLAPPPTLNSSLLTLHSPSLPLARLHVFQVDLRATCREPPARLGREQVRHVNRRPSVVAFPRHALGKITRCERTRDMKPIPVWIRNVLVGLLTVGVLFLFLAIVGWWLDKGYRESESDTVQTRRNGQGFASLPGFERPNPMAKVDPELRQLEASPMKKFQKAEWQDTTVNVHSSGGGSWFGWLSSSRQKEPRRVAAKQSCYLAPHTGIAVEIPVVIFITDSDATWLGPAQDFYVETDSGIVGGKAWGDAILWCRSLTDKRPDNKPNFAGIMTRFEMEVDGNILDTAYNGGAQHEPYLKRLTNLRDVFAKTNRMLASRPSDPKIETAEVHGNTVRLEMKEDDSVAVWIDIKTKKLLKAELNGKQVFPKSWWPW